MKQDFLGQKILLLTAHPDDESYAAAGTIYKNYQAGGWTVLVCATYGEKGTSHLKKKISATELKKLRKREMTKAAKLLHIAPTHFIGLPDGKVRANKKKIYEYFLKQANKYKPQVIMGYGPDGISGHHDHVAVGIIARRVAKKIKVPYAAFTLPPKIQKQALAYLKTRRQAKHYINDIKFMKPNITVRINPAIKKKALRCHASQMDGSNAFTGFPEFAVKELLKAEHFVFYKER